MSIAADLEVGITPDGTTVSWSDVCAAVGHVRECLRLRLRTGACAARLLYELAGHWCGLPQSFGDDPVLVDVFAAVDEIGEIERAETAWTALTKPACRFNSGVLEGLWHIRCSQGSFMKRDLKNEISKRGESLIIKRLVERYERHGWGAHTIDSEMVSLLTHAGTCESLDHRAGDTTGDTSRLIGEWIVFAKTGGRNIYLTLGGHGEMNEAILERCLPAVREFKDLATTSPFSALQR
jgi:hypothetical protein